MTYEEDLDVTLREFEALIKDNGSISVGRVGDETWSAPSTESHSSSSSNLGETTPASVASHGDITISWDDIHQRDTYVEQQGGQWLLSSSCEELQDVHDKYVQHLSGAEQIWGIDSREDWAAQLRHPIPTQADHLNMLVPSHEAECGFPVHKQKGRRRKIREGEHKEHEHGKGEEGDGA
ncbi:hypothetical protein OBBRIDRAFT_827449 [Obba rivulosa]|uniref:Uncharacterized protein n=1 Tax=Obba rivulosa TaxID=1052685 RepID=A0A8E2DMD7_9APHY|nr:hypothetical protein OBBRIDRAFT_827449 [Obba rivulosa]